MRESMEKEHGEDIISKLPDDILVSIISRLTLREATRTSILSTPWRYLHLYATRLDFSTAGKREKTDYAKMVNHVLGSHRGSRIKELKVKVLHSNGGQNSYKEWFEFALIKEAEIIHMKIDSYMKGGVLGQISNDILLHGLKYLKDLSLSMNVEDQLTDQEFDLLVNNCPVLESLSIQSCLGLRNVSIVGHSKLRHLHLFLPWYLGSLVIRDAISLVYFKCAGLGSRKCTVQLSNIPKLIKLGFSENNRYTLPHPNFFLRLPSCIRHQLHSIHLSITIFSPPIYQDDHVVGLVNVKHLELNLHVRECQASLSYYIHRLYRLIAACASLQQLTINFLWSEKALEKKGVERYDNIGMYRNYNNNIVKEMQIRGYFGSPSELILASEVIRKAGALEKLLVVPCDLNDTIRGEALSRARQDFPQIITPSRTRLFIV